MKTCYVVTKPGMINLSKGVFTNKKMLFDSISTFVKQHQYTVTFQGALRYERKKFNYSNLNKLLGSLKAKDSFMLRLSIGEKTLLFEITVQEFNIFTHTS